MTTEEMLLQLIEGQKQTNERLDKMDKRFDKMDKRIDIIENDIKNIKDDIEEIKIEANITRVALNGLIERTEDYVKLQDPTYKF